MTLANMREQGSARSWPRAHEAVLEADQWPAEMPVPDIGLKLRCSACGGQEIATLPNWRGQSITGT
jgi:hypothetical protein